MSKQRSQPAVAPPDHADGDPEKHTDPALPYDEPLRHRSRGGIAFAVVLALAAGVALGLAVRGQHPSEAHDEHVHAAANGKKQLWTCSMHPQVIRDEPGSCPICHMALTPVKAEGGGEAAGGVTIDPVVVQNMGVRVAPVITGPLAWDIRAVGYLDEAQPNIRDVNLRVSGWVEKLYADTVGMALSKGAPLFDLYSPEVQVAAGELIAARKAADAPGADPTSRRAAQTLLEAARQKLEQWGLDPAQVNKLAAMDQAPRDVTFTSPIDGYLTQKAIVRGAAVKSGDTVLRIVDLSTVWLDAQVYARDLPFVRLGRTVTASVEGLPGKTFEGEVIFVQPEVDPQTRTATVRIALPNTELALRPGMYATAHILAKLAEDVVLVPREAVIDTGARQVAFVSVGGGRFEARQVKMGAENEGGTVQILAGLAPGETVVTSGQFLLDAESRMREAIQKHLEGNLLARGGTHPVEAEPMAAGPATQPAATTVPAVAGPATAPAGSPDVDRLFATYLTMQKVLGAAEQADTPVDPTALLSAARAVEAQANGDARPLANAVVAAAAAMQGKPLTEQRRLFSPLSDAVIALAKARPPSRAVAGRLFVAYCPMAPGNGGRWLQAGEGIEDPYFATRMKDCGSIEQPLETRP